MKICAFAVLLGLVVGAFAQPQAASHLITYQGRLTDGDGQPLDDGEYHIVFRIYQEEASSEPLWAEELAVTLNGGMFSAILGTTGTLDDAVFQDGRGWMGITVNEGEELLPRTLMTKVPFAARAAWSDRASIAYTASSNSVTSNSIVDGSIQLIDLGDNGALPGDVLKFDGSSWRTEPGAASNITSIYGGAGLNGGGTAGDLILEIAPNGVTSSMIGSNVITGTELANNAVGTGHILDNAVSASKIQSNAVTTTKIQDDAVTSAKIGSNAVGTTQLIDNSVTTNDIANYTITNSDVSNSADINPSKIYGDAATLNRTQVFHQNNYFLGNVGIGTSAVTSHKLNITSSGSGVPGATAFIKNTNATGLGMIVEATSSDLPLLISQKGSGDILRCDSYTGGWHPVFKVKNDGTTEVSVLTITGGADVAEPFPTSGTDDITEGSVVVIDEDHPGSVKLSTEPYDTRVAGIVSGANGVKPGLTLSQQEKLGSGQYVALSGRVYALVDASFGAIRPGDMLTTSPTPGHAMRATDRTRSYGAVIGKAMTPLTEGRGLVLVLVNLQ